MVTGYGLRVTGYGCGTCSTMPLAVSYVMEAFSLSWAESSSTWGEEETTEAGENDRQWARCVGNCEVETGHGTGGCGRMGCVAGRDDTCVRRMRGCRFRRSGIDC